MLFFHADPLRVSIGGKLPPSLDLGRHSEQAESLLPQRRKRQPHVSVTPAFQELKGGNHGNFRITGENRPGGVLTGFNQDIPSVLLGGERHPERCQRGCRTRQQACFKRLVKLGATPPAPRRLVPSIIEAMARGNDQEPLLPDVNLDPTGETKRSSFMVLLSTQ